MSEHVPRRDTSDNLLGLIVRTTVEPQDRGEALLNEKGYFLEESFSPGTWLQLSRLGSDWPTWSRLLSKSAIAQLSKQITRQQTVRVRYPNGWGQTPEVEILHVL